MVIIYEGGQNFALKTKNTTIELGDKMMLGSFSVTEPGEYEVGGIQLEAIDGVSQVFIEGMVVGHIKNAKTLSETELEKLSSINILLIGVGGGEFGETKTAIETINQIDPQLVIPMHGGNIEDFIKAEAANSVAQDELKINKADLSADERQVVILNARR